MPPEADPWPQGHTPKVSGWQAAVGPSTTALPACKGAAGGQKQRAHVLKAALRTPQPLSMPSATAAASLPALQAGRRGGQGRNGVTGSAQDFGLDSRPRVKGHCHTWGRTGWGPGKEHPT